MDKEKIIEYAENFGFEHDKIVAIDYFIFPNEAISLHFVSFIHTLSGLTILTEQTLSSYKKSKKNLNKIHFTEGSILLGPHGESNGEPLTPDLAEMFNSSFKNLLSSVENTPDIFSSMFLITLVSKFEAYIQEIIEEISIRYPSTMNSSKTITFHEVLKFNEMESLIQYLASEVASNATQGLPSQYLCRIGKTFGIQISEFGDLLQEIEKYIDIRHLHVHTNGVVDQKFAKKYPKLKNIGERYTLDFKELAWISCLFRLTVNLIEVMLTSKFSKIEIVSLTK